MKNLSLVHFHFVLLHDVRLLHQDFPFLTRFIFFLCLHTSSFGSFSHNSSSLGSSSKSFHSSLGSSLSTTTFPSSLPRLSGELRATVSPDSTCLIKTFLGCLLQPDNWTHHRRHIKMTNREPYLAWLGLAWLGWCGGTADPASQGGDRIRTCSLQVMSLMSQPIPLPRLLL